MHQKSVVLHGADMAIFGSSNWTSSSSDTQREHNYFTSKTWFVDWFKDTVHQEVGQPARATAPPSRRRSSSTTRRAGRKHPVNVSPTNVALGVASSVTLKWEGGWWAHKYDIYFGTTNPPPLVAQNFMPGSATAGVSSSKESFNPCAPPAPFVSACPGGLAPGTTYYWRIRGKTMIGDGGGPFNAPARAINGPVWSFTTAGSAPALASPANLTSVPGLADADRSRLDRRHWRIRIQDRAQARRGERDRLGADRDDRAPTSSPTRTRTGSGRNELQLPRSGLGASRRFWPTAIRSSSLTPSPSTEASRITGRRLRPRRAIRERQLRHRHRARHQVHRRYGIPARSVRAARHQRRPTRTNRAAAPLRQAVRHAGGERRDGHRPALDERVDRDDGDLEQPAGRRGGHVGHGGGLGHDRAVVRDRRHGTSAGAASGWTELGWYRVAGHGGHAAVCRVQCTGDG